MAVDMAAFPSGYIPGAHLDYQNGDSAKVMLTKPPLTATNISGPSNPIEQAGWKEFQATTAYPVPGTETWIKWTVDVNTWDGVGPDIYHRHQNQPLSINVPSGTYPIRVVADPYAVGTGGVIEDGRHRTENWNVCTDGPQLVAKGQSNPDGEMGTNTLPGCDE